MVVPQSGAVYTYAMLPFFYFLGINIFSFRLAASVFMVLSFIVFCCLCKDLVGRRFAVIASLLYIFDSTVFFLNRYRAQDSLLLLIMILVTFLFYRFYLTKRNKYLCLSSFFAGLGLSFFILFLRFLIPFLIVILIFYFTMLVKKKIKFVFNIRKYLITIGLFCAGAFMFIIYNIVTRGTIKFLYNILINGTSFGINNLDFFNNLKISIPNILYLKNFAYPEQSPLIFFTPGPLLSAHISILLLISIAFLIVLLFFIKSEERIKVSFLLTLLLFFILIGNFTTSTFADFDYVIYVPIFMIIITTALYFGFRSLFNLFKISKSRKKRYAFLSLVLVL